MTPLLVNRTGLPGQYVEGMNEGGAFVPWALSQHATVAELVAAPPHVRVVESGSAELRAALSIL
jgi:hypothetical protein